MREWKKELRQLWNTEKKIENQPVERREDNDYQMKCEYKYRIDKSKKGIIKNRVQEKDEMALAKPMIQNAKIPFVEIEKGVNPEINLVHQEKAQLLTFESSELQLKSGKEREESEIELEVIIGLDLGTSTVKAVINESTLENTIAVPFTEAKGIEAYLLPTILYKDRTEQFTLETQDPPYWSDLKSSLMDSPKNVDKQALLAIFLALVFKRIRGWYFERKRDDILDAKLYWQIIMGVPSNSADGELGQTWVKVGKAAWKLSKDREIPPLVQVMELLRQEVKIDEIVKVKPEISALTYAIISKSIGENDRPFVLVDVGATTVDVCAFWFTKGKTRGGQKGKYNTTIKLSKVEKYGTAVCHKQRINFWNEAIKNTLEREKTESLEKLKASLWEEENLLPDMMLPNSYRDYVAHASICGVEENKDPDSKIIGIVARLTREAIMAFGGRYKGKKVHVYVAGGGSRSEIYERAIERAVTHKKDHAELREPIKDLSILFQDQNGDGALNSAEVWLRLSTAFGLSQDELGDVGEDEQPVIAKRKDFGDKYISKDQM